MLRSSLTLKSWKLPAEFISMPLEDVHPGVIPGGYPQTATVFPTSYPTTSPQELRGELFQQLRATRESELTCYSTGAQSTRCHK